MRRSLVLAALLAVAPAHAEGEVTAEAPGAPAFRLDSAACPAFLSGIWLANSQQDVGRGGDPAIWHVTQALVLDASGRLEFAFAAGIAGDEPEETKTFGAWTAGPGAAAETCALTLVFEESERRTLSVTATSQTRMQAGGQSFTRAR